MLNYFLPFYHWSSSLVNDRLRKSNVSFKKKSNIKSQTVEGNNSLDVITNQSLYINRILGHYTCLCNLEGAIAATFGIAVEPFSCSVGTKLLMACNWV